MKRISILLICIIAITNGRAQIKDNDAKLQFQDATDAYESTDYYKASTISQDLKDKMHKWTPKVLYLFLESVYKNYTETEQKNELKYPVTFQKFQGFKALNDSFFLLLDKSSYPQEKYSEMQKVQQYFLQMTKKTEYQTTRTPEKALAFLNECAKKFPSRLGEESYHSIIQDPYLNLRIDSSYLRIVYVDKIKSQSKNKWNKVNHYIDYIDLVHLPYIDEAKNIPDERVYSILSHEYDLDNKFEFNKQDTIPNNLTNLWLENGQELLFYKQWSKTKNKYLEDNHYSKKANLYDILSFFDNKNKEFQEGKYAERIKEAFWFIINYFPKQKTKAKEKIEDKRVNGF